MQNTTEKLIHFYSEDFCIEGLFCRNDGENGVVITHPHPLYGGDMHNQVVQTVAMVYQEKGFSSLRFNFRGVGNSKGRYDEGRGEAVDAESALNYMYEEGKRNIDLAGYSFGSWVNLRVSNASRIIKRMIMISPPLAFFDFSSLRQDLKISAIITGEKDEIAPAEMIRKAIGIWNPNTIFKVIEGADHFYTGRMDTVKDILCNIVS